MVPMEVTDKEVFKKIVERAVECRVYKSSDKGFAKIKARTKSKLVTIKIPLDELEAFLKDLRCQNIVEF